MRHAYLCVAHVPCVALQVQNRADDVSISTALSVAGLLGSGEKPASGSRACETRTASIPGPHGRRGCNHIVMRRWHGGHGGSSHRGGLRLDDAPAGSPAAPAAGPGPPARRARGGRPTLSLSVDSVDAACRSDWQCLPAPPRWLWPHLPRPRWANGLLSSAMAS
jgi:hypothetical protein